MNNTGFIKLHRSILGWSWYRDLNTRSLFIHLLLTACWEDARHMNRVIKRGQCCTTVKELATDNRQTIQQIRTALEHLKSTNDITIETTPQFSIITITNYDLYQQGGRPINSQAADERQTSPQTSPPEINKPSIYKEEKNIRNEEESARLRALINSAVGEYNSVCRSLDAVSGDISYHVAQLVRQAETQLRGVTFREYFARVERSDFLTGRTGRFRATFEWLMRAENIAKVLSGKYDGSYSASENKAEERDYNAPLW